MAFIFDDYMYEPEGTAAAKKTTSFFDSIQALITPPKFEPLQSEPSGYSASPQYAPLDDGAGNIWVDTPGGGGHWRAADGRIWSDSANAWVEDPTAAIAAVSGIGNAATPNSPFEGMYSGSTGYGSGDSAFDEMQTQNNQQMDWQSKLNAAVGHNVLEGRSQPWEYLAASDPGAFNSKYGLLSDIYKGAGKVADWANFQSPSQYSLPPLGVNLTGEDPTGWNGQPKNAFGNDRATNRDAGLGINQFLDKTGASGAYDWYTKNVQTPFAETASQLTGPAFRLNAGAMVPFLEPVLRATGKDIPGLPDFGGIGQLADTVTNTGSFSDFRDQQNEKFAARPIGQQLLASTIYDPTNLLGAGIGTKALQTGAVTSRIGRGLATADKALDVAQTKAAFPLAMGAVGFGASALQGNDTETNLLAGLGFAGAGLAGKALVGPVGKLTKGGFGGSVIEDVSGPGPQRDLFGNVRPQPQFANLSAEAEVARKQLLTNLRENRIVRNDGITEAEKSAGRSRQVSGMLSALTEGELQGLSGRELLERMANGIGRGPLIQTTAGPLQLTPDIQNELDDVITAYLKEDPTRRAYKARTAFRTLDEIYAGGMPQPKQDEILREIFGDDIVDAISGPKKVPVEELGRASTMPLDLGEQSVASQPPLIGERQRVGGVEGDLGDWPLATPKPLTADERTARDAILAKQASERTTKEAADLAAFEERDRQFLEAVRRAGNTGGPQLSFEDEALIGANPVSLTPEQKMYRDVLIVRQSAERDARMVQQEAAYIDHLRRAGETDGSPLGLELGGEQLTLDSRFARDAEGNVTGALPVEGRFPLTGEVVKPRTLTKKKILDFAKAAGLEVFSLPRALKSSMDLSAPLRQGAILGWKHPKAAASAFAAQIQAWGSEEAARAIDKTLDIRPNARIHRESGLYRAALNSADEGLTAQEEVFVSRIADKIPFVRNSERAYSTYLNKLRADSFDAVWNSLPELEKTSQRAKDLASFINVASGRGELSGRLAGSGPLLGTVLYAPRYLVSRPQAVWMAATKAGVRKEATYSLLAYASGTSTILALGNAAGIWDVELDPRSSDFGKARIGPLRYDLWTGYSQLGRLMAQFSLAALEPLDGKGGIRIPNAFKSTETGDTRDISATQPLSRFTRSKLAPGAGLVANLISQKDYRGAPYDPSVEVPGLGEGFDTAIGALIELAGPLSPTDFVTAWNEYSWEMALTTLPSLVGVGASLYEPSATEALDKIAKETEYVDADGKTVKGTKFYDLPAGVQAQIKDAHPDLAKQLDDSKTSPEAKANVAATRALTEQQLRADEALRARTMTPDEWRSSFSARQDELLTRKDQIYANVGKSPGKDPVLDGYFKTIEDATDGLGEVDWARVDAYRAGLSETQNKYLDDNTGLSLGTPTVKQYRADMDRIDGAGYWEIRDAVWKEFQEAYGIPTDMNEKAYWTSERLKIQKEAEEALDQSAPQWRAKYPNAANELTDIEVQKMITKFTGFVTKDRQKWRAEHPEEAALLAKWGIAGTGATETRERIADALD